MTNYGPTDIDLSTRIELGLRMRDRSRACGEASALPRNGTRVSGRHRPAPTEAITVQEGGIAIARGTNVTIREGGAFLVAAEHAEVQNGSVVFLAVQEVSGDAKILFDVKAAVLFGLVVGLVVGLLKRFAGLQEQAPQ